MNQKVKDIVIPSNIVEIWQRIIDSFSSLLNIPSVMINRIDASELEVFRSNISKDNPFTSGMRVPLLGVYCETTARTKMRLQVEDAQKDPVWANSPLTQLGILSYLGFPIFWPNGDVFGTICAVDTKANKWLSPSDSLLQTVKDAVEAHLGLLDSMEKLRKKNKELKTAVKEIKTLQGLLPMCAYCRKIRDDKGYWSQLESYIGKHFDTQFSHGICPECFKKEMQKMQE
jgi:c-di-GMP phosphodiesterase